MSSNDIAVTKINYCYFFSVISLSIWHGQTNQKNNLMIDIKTELQTALYPNAHDILGILLYFPVPGSTYSKRTSTFYDCKSVFRILEKRLHRHLHFLNIFSENITKYQHEQRPVSREKFIVCNEFLKTTTCTTTVSVTYFETFIINSE